MFGCASACRAEVVEVPPPVTDTPSVVVETPTPELDRLGVWGAPGGANPAFKPSWVWLAYWFLPAADEEVAAPSQSNPAKPSFDHTAIPKGMDCRDCHEAPETLVDRSQGSVESD